jgi:hypothetical protein
MTREDILAYYEDGNITEMEFSNLMLQNVTEENVAEFFDKTPIDLKSLVVQRALAYRPDMKTFRMGSYIIRNDADEKKLREHWANEDRNYVRGVGVVKRFIDDYCDKLWGKK